MMTASNAMPDVQVVEKLESPIPALVSVSNLVKRFGEFTAVNDISFHVNEGEIFGLLGPNGAGKSTTIKMICTLLKPTAGTILVAGTNVVSDPDRVRSSIGIVFQDTSLDSALTGQENLDFQPVRVSDVRRIIIFVRQNGTNANNGSKTFGPIWVTKNFAPYLASEQQGSREEVIIYYEP